MNTNKTAALCPHVSSASANQFSFLEKAPGKEHAVLIEVWL